MDEIQNPFHRLNEQLTAARNLSGTAATIDVWASVFKCDASNSALLVNHFSALLDLVSDARAAAERFIPGDKTRFLAPLDRIDKLLKSQHLARPWAQFKPYLDDGTMVALDFGVYAMSQYYPGASAEGSEQIRDFVQKLDVLLEECLTSDLSAELKSLFIKHLESLRAALMKFRVEGMSGLEDAMDAIIGSIHRNSGPINAEAESGKVIIQKFFDVLGKVNDMISGYQTAAQIAAPAVTALLLPLLN
jgi:hypothetical protein